MTTARSAGAYAEVRGLRMYYEVHGTGAPIVLLHGAFGTIESTFDDLITRLARSRRVVSVELQAHGRTSDRDRPLTFEDDADDAAELIRQLGLGPIDVFGCSDGGNAALAMAMRTPEIVRSLSIAGTNIDNDALYPQVRDYLTTTTPAEFEADAAPMRTEYERVAPRPDAFPVLVEKSIRRTNEFAGWSRDELRQITASALIIVADDDIVPPEHGVELFRLLPRARLAVLPVTDHPGIVERSAWLFTILSAFLEASVDETAP